MINKFFSALFLFFHVTAFFSAAQNVGVGTVTPAEKLHVAGNIKGDTVKPAAIKFTPSAGNGKILTSDADGNASWRTMDANSGGGGAGFGSWGDCATNANIGAYQPMAHPNAGSGDQFGKTVSMSGNFAVAGAQSDDVGANSNQGSAHVFYFNGTRWVHFQELLDPSGMTDDLFGISVSISGDYIAVGSIQADVGANADQGTVSIFHFDGVNWAFMEQLVDPVGQAGDNFGRSVCLSGDRLVVGANVADVSVTDQGSASVFHFDGTSWVYVQQLVHPVPANGDDFGRSVSISGDFLVVGAQSDDIGANNNQGSAHVYQFDGTNWVYIVQLFLLTGAAGDAFGWSVSISGNFIAVGVYHSSTFAGNAGKVSLYNYDGAFWTFEGDFGDEAPLGGDQFGYSVCLTPSLLMIGANLDNAAGMDHGSAVIYQRVGLGWQKIQLVIDPAGRIGNDFGISVMIDETTRRFLVGVSGYLSNSGKAIFGKIN